MYKPGRKNDFNSQFERALGSKLKLQESKGGQLDADAELKRQQAQFTGLDARSAAGLRGAQAGLYGEQARLAERDVNSLVGSRDATARSSNIASNIAGGTFLSELDPKGFKEDTSFDPFNYGGSNSAGSIYDSEDSGTIGGTQPYKRDYGLGYALGGVVSPMVDPDYELYRDAAVKSGVAVLPPQEAIQRMAQLRAAKRAQVMQMIEQGGTTPQGYASGGMIEGPGTGKSDSIPATVDGVGKAAVSDGEFLIPRHVVDYFGTKMLDGLVEKARMAVKANARKPGYAQGGVVKKPASKLTVVEVDKLTPADMDMLHKKDMAANIAASKAPPTAEDIYRSKAAERARTRFEQKAAMPLPEDIAIPDFSGTTYGDLYAHLQNTQGRGLIGNIIPANMAPK
jgi:hypothetical protein